MQKDYVEIGKIVSARGVRGEVKVLPWSDAPEDLERYDHFYIKKAAGYDELSVESARAHNGTVLLKFRGVETVGAASSLKGQVLFVKASDLPVLPEGRHYLYELIGLTVVLPDGSTLGEIKDVLQTGANDVYVVGGGGKKERLIPAIPDVVKSVSLERGEVFITPIPGLLED